MRLQASPHGHPCNRAMPYVVAGTHWQARLSRAGSDWLPDCTSMVYMLVHDGGCRLEWASSNRLTYGLQWVHACYSCYVAQVIALFSPVSADDADGNGLGGTDSLSVSEQVV